MLDNFSKVIGAHSIKFGGTLRFNMSAWKNIGSNGSFSFNGSETGIDFADYLIGAPNSFSQGQGYTSNGRNLYFGLFGQDSWRARQNLTFNFGLRYEIATPWWEEHNEIQSLEAGLQSVVFPGSPTGWVFPGDPGIPKDAGSHPLRECGAAGWSRLLSACARGFSGQVDRWSGEQQYPRQLG